MQCSTETIGGWLVDRLDEVDSTNSHARRMIIERPRPCESARIFVARTQTAGRGRLGRAWASPEGGLWCTFLWPLPCGDARGGNPHASLDGLGLRVGVACTRAIEDIIE